MYAKHVACLNTTVHKQLRGQDWRCEPEVGHFGQVVICGYARSPLGASDQAAQLHVGCIARRDIYHSTRIKTYT